MAAAKMREATGAARPAPATAAAAPAAAPARSPATESPANEGPATERPAAATPAPPPTSPAQPPAAARPAASKPASGTDLEVSAEIEAELAAIRAEELTGRQLRMAMRVAQKHGIRATSGLEAVRLLRRRGIDPFEHSTLLDIVRERDEPSRALTTTTQPGLPRTYRQPPPPARPPPVPQPPATRKSAASSAISPAAAAAGWRFWARGCWSSSRCRR